MKNNPQRKKNKYCENYMSIISEYRLKVNLRNIIVKTQSNNLKPALLVQ